MRRCLVRGPVYSSSLVCERVRTINENDYVVLTELVGLAAMTIDSS